MTGLIDIMLVLLLLLNLLALSSGRLTSCIRLLAIQGTVIAIFPVFAHLHTAPIRTLIMALIATAVKGVALPRMLNRAYRDTQESTEKVEGVSTAFAMGLGLVFLLTAYLIADRLPLPGQSGSPLVLTVSLFTMLTGFSFLILRVKALAQIMGYLILENGIYLFGAAALSESPFLVELGILLDVFVAIFVMGIMVFHISREFESTDSEKMSTLSDWHKDEEP